MPIRPKNTVMLKDGKQPFPIFQINAAIHVKPASHTPCGSAARAVKIVNAVAGQHERVAKMNILMLRHPAYLLIWFSGKMPRYIEANAFSLLRRAKEIVQTLR